MLSKNPKISFEYTALLFAWLFWGISQFLSRLQSGLTIPIYKICYISFSQSIVCYIATIICVVTIIKLRQSTNLETTILISLFIVVTISFLLAFVNLSLYNYLKGSSKVLSSLNKYIINGTEKIFFVGGYTTIFFFIRNADQYLEQKTITEKAELTARNAQLQVLQQQLNPHFLFNSLNSLRRLITIDTCRAVDMLNDLTKFLNNTLTTTTTVQNTIKEEMELVEYYLKIQKVRFQDEIEFQLSVDKELAGFIVPKFILQPLVENAVKYGMITSSMPLQLFINANKEKEKICLEVINSGTLTNTKTSEYNKNGLKNTQLRLELMFPNSATIELLENNGLVYSRICINRRR